MFHVIIRLEKMCSSTSKVQVQQQMLEDADAVVILLLWFRPVVVNISAALRLIVIY